MIITIQLRTAKEDISPERSQKIHGFIPDFAESVRKVMKEAKKKDPKSLWGWCTVDVIVQIKGTLGDTVGYDSLGGCSYYSEIDFIKSSGYYDDMVNRAMASAMQQYLALADIKTPATA